jgi:small conductance mechanosensitive channel
MQNVDADTMEKILALVIQYGVQVLGAIVILVIGRIVSNILGGTIRRAMDKANMEEALKRFVVSLVKTGIMVFAVIAALNKFGVQTTSFVAVIGAAGLAVGLALQGSLSNFAAGVLILVFKPFRIDDAIEAGGATGKVADIGIFTTTINTFDNKKVIVPNAAITSGTITNINAYETRRVDLTAGIGYGDDIGKAKQVLTDILANHPKVLQDPAPNVQLLELADSSVNFIVRPWVKTEDYWTVYFDVMRSIKEQFDANGISIPFPQRDVHLHQVSSN